MSPIFLAVAEVSGGRVNYLFNNLFQSSTTLKEKGGHHDNLENHKADAFTNFVSLCHTKYSLLEEMLSLSIIDQETCIAKVCKEMNNWLPN